MNQVLQKLAASSVATSQWLNEQGLDKRSAYQYVKNNWLESLGTGAYKRYGDLITWEGALYTIQSQLALEIHVGARTALEMQGKAHNVSFGSNKTFLFTSTKSSSPKWFQFQKWQTDIKLVKTQFLNPDIGIRDLELNNFKIRISSVEGRFQKLSI
ncbi:MAG: AbiEi antitoxin N-terminal domain-containing protein [Candidatus Melainabacteria bacterium]|nr:AbiEi antitoxin N-terminal domain-containing protein [Candidatus Melainabacteria bacterium]